MSLNDEQKHLIRELLEKHRQEISAHIEQLRESSRPVSPDNAIGRISRIDAMQNQQLAGETLHREQSRLAMIKGAFSRIDTPGFGICTDCGEPIPWARLQARPESIRCVKCSR